MSIEKELEERELAHYYIESVSADESLQEQESKYWEFRNYSIKIKGSHDLRSQVYKIHTEEFNKKLRELK